jgi:hypothetical protein
MTTRFPLSREERRVYPRRRPGWLVDDRFTTAVVTDVAEVLLSHGFPAIDDDTPDFYALMFSLVRFVYGDPHGRADGRAKEGGLGGYGAVRW